MAKTIIGKELLVNRHKYVMMLMTIIKLPIDAFIEPELREYAESEILKLVGEP